MERKREREREKPHSFSVPVLATPTPTPVSTIHTHGEKDEGFKTKYMSAVRERRDAPTAFLTPASRALIISILILLSDSAFDNPKCVIKKQGLFK